MPVHSKNPRLALLDGVPAHIFWGFRSFLDCQHEFGVFGPEYPVVIADKGFIDRRKTVFSINREWGLKGQFVSNPSPAPLQIPDYIEPVQDAYVLELGQDETDFSYLADCDGYAEFLENWPDRKVRPHPKVRPTETPLAGDLAGARLVVGLNTSALIAASLAGLKVEAFGAHSMALGMDRGRENCLRTLRSYEWDRRDQAAAGAIIAALREPQPAPEAPKAKTRTQTKRKASQRKKK